MIPTVKITPQGYDIPSREQVEAGLWKMFRDAFGQDLNADVRSPQGQLVTTLTALLRDKDAQLVELANNFDPRYAGGVWQEGLGAVYFLSRDNAKASVVKLEFEGLAATVVPVGTQVQDDAGLLWLTTETGTIAGNGKVEVWAACAETGPVAAAAGSIQTLVDSIAGIDRVTNPLPCIIGTETESRADYELRRINSVSVNGQLTDQAVAGAVFDLDGVLDVRVVGNHSDATIQVGKTDYPMIRNSLLVSVVGGDDYTIAGEIMRKGGTGCSFVGNTEVLWRDTDNWDDDFPPEYHVKFLRPDPVSLYWDIRLMDYDSVTMPQLNKLKQSIIDQMAGGTNKARIGSKVVPASFNCPLATELRVIDIRVSLDDAAWVELVEFGIDQIPVTDASMITVRQYE